jgi:hypothetical protein
VSAGNKKAAPSGKESRRQEFGAATMKTPSNPILPLQCLMCGKNLSQASEMPRKGSELLCETCAHTPFSSAHDLPWHCVLCGKALELHNDNSSGPDVTFPRSLANMPTMRGKGSTRRARLYTFQFRDGTNIPLQNT